MNTDMKKKLDVLNAVWLYDEDEDCRRMVDESAEYGVYAHEALRKHDATLHSYGEDYARAAAPQLAEEPMGLVESVLAGMPEERRGVYQGEFDSLKLSGKDTRQDYYALFGKMVRDEVRGKYAEAKAEEARQKELLEQQAADYEALIAGGLAGTITAPTPEQFALLNRGGVKWESIVRARRASGLAKGDKVNQSLAADMVEGDEVARQLVLQEVARSSKKHREEMEGENYFTSTFYGGVRTLEHFAAKVDRYLPRASTPSRELDVTRGQLRFDADGHPYEEFLTPDEQEARRKHRAAFLGDVALAREAGVAEAEEGIGWKFSHMPANLTRMALDLGEFIHPVTRAYNIAHFAEDAY